MFKPISPSKQKAFTLVELLTVMVVLVALATITVKSTAQFSFDSRYQITEDRYNKIKTAILGNPNQTINGHPSVSGFVADMGRLPHCLRELIDGKCVDTDTPPTASQKNADTKLWYGWRGSYIETNNNPSITNALADGWGNVAQCFNTTTPLNDYLIQTSCQNAGYTWIFGNYGWYFDKSSNQLTIKSYGKDGLPNGTNEYDRDYPPPNSPIMVKSTDWLSTESTINVNVLSKMNVIISRPTDSATCTNYGGTWSDVTTPNCKMPAQYEYTSQTCPPPNTWNTGYCSNSFFTTQSSCITINTWTNGFCSNNTLTTQADCESTNTWNEVGYCSNTSYLNKTDCELALETWTVTSASCSNSLLTNQAACEETNTWTAGHCSNSSLTTQPVCEAHNVWTLEGCPVIISTVPNNKAICLDLRYHDGENNGQITAISPVPATISEDGNSHNVMFSVPNLPLGQAAFKIIDCATTKTYPIENRDFKIVDILPNRSLNFDW